MRRRLPPLVLLYVTLDFANLLMPGAVRFEGGRVDVVQADRPARVGASTVPAPVRLPTVSLPPSEIAVDRRALVPASLRRRPPRLVHRSVPESSEAPAPSTEDH